MDRFDTLWNWVLRASQERLDGLPPFPAVATRIVDALEQPEAELRDVEGLIEQDSVISAQVLRTANSVIYGGAMPVETVSQAVMRLGFRETAQVAMTAACRVLFNMEDRAELELYPELWRAFWLDSLLSAYGGRLLARELKCGRAEHVFLGGLFHNLGGLIILKLIAHGMVHRRIPFHPNEDELERVIEILHAELGENYLRRCHVPDYVAVVAARHHDAEVAEGPHHDELHVVRLSDGLGQRIGAVPFARGELGPLAEDSAAYLGVDAERLEYFELQFEELAGQLRELLD